MFRLILMALAATVSLQAYSLPLPRLGPQSTEIPSSFTANYDFEGIVALDNCSGSLVRYVNSKDQDKAMVLTNGHCYERGFIRSGTYLANIPSNRSFNVLNANGNSVGRVRATRLLYGTMTKTDMALYEVALSFAEIQSQYGVRALTLADTQPSVGLAIEVISGYWNRGYRCQVESIVPELREDSWTWVDAIRYSRPGCEVIGGTSGSPIVASGSRTVVGVNNTGNESGGKCTRNNPCEVDEAGNIFYKKGYSYGEQTYWVYSCLNSDNQIDLTLSGCQLFR